ncbi:MAG: helix-turn-helix domain-containing protein [Methylococcaceae bacterium]|nr:helix-turn-helix domain-containing protein [Methylococcaceae bacterium]
MNSLHDQIKKRRKELGFNQEDMANLIGMARQQYQRLESKGNPRLDTLELIAKGLKMELMLIPKDKTRAIKNILDNAPAHPALPQEQVEQENDPWKGLLEDE